MWDMATTAQGTSWAAVGSGAGGPCKLKVTSETTPPTARPASSNGSSPPAPPFAGYSVRFKLVAAIVLTAAIGGLVLAYMGLSESDSDGIVRSGGTSDFVEELLPAEGSQVVQQTPIGIDLASGWEGTLVVDGREIPPDQLNRRPALNRIEFTPGEGKVLASLPGGRVCVTAIVWETRAGRSGARNVNWCFDVV
jgi:hypothetical protein